MIGSEGIVEDQENRTWLVQERIIGMKIIGMKNIEVKNIVLSNTH